MAFGPLLCIILAASHTSIEPPHVVLYAVVCRLSHGEMDHGPRILRVYSPRNSIFHAPVLDLVKLVSRLMLHVKECPIGRPRLEVAIRPSQFPDAPELTRAEYNPKSLSLFRGRPHVVGHLPKALQIVAEH